MMKKLVSRLEAEIKNPAKGLPEEIFLFASRITPLITVDLLIKDERGRTLLTWRDDGYYQPGWHIPGGIVRYKETIAARIAQTALTELGAGVKVSGAPLAVKEFIHPSRQDRGHSISLLYKCRLTGEPDKGRAFTAGSPKPGQWAWHRACPANLFSVHAVYREYLQPKGK